MDNITSNIDSLPKETSSNVADFDTSGFKKVYQPLDISASLKSVAEDFIVEEIISVDFSGEGEHCWLHIKKRGCNTDWVAQQLADYCEVKRAAVSYAGLKDRHAVTSQWFSVQLPGKPTPDWTDFELLFLKQALANGANNAKNSARDSARDTESVQVLQCFRHSKKLQRGALKGNLFKITLRGLSDTSDESFNLLIQRCHQIAKSGVPNYFGPQRFGRNGNNLEQAENFFARSGCNGPGRNRSGHKLTKHKRGLYFSAARSWLFNGILSARIKKNVWNTALPGDVFMLDGKSACFKSDDAGDEMNEERSGEISDELKRRLAANEIHPTAILWGEGDIMVQGAAAELESSIINQFPAFRDGLIAARLQAHRRACRVVPGQFEGVRQGDDFVLSFSLPAGSYATMVLAEIFNELSESR